MEINKPPLFNSYLLSNSSANNSASSEEPLFSPSAVRQCLYFHPLNHKSWILFQWLFTPPAPRVHTYLQEMPSKFLFLYKFSTSQTSSTCSLSLCVKFGHMFYTTWHCPTHSTAQTLPSLLPCLHLATEQKETRCAVQELSYFVIIPSWSQFDHDTVFRISFDFNFSFDFKFKTSNQQERKLHHRTHLLHLYKR